MGPFAYPRRLFPVAGGPYNRRWSTRASRRAPGPAVGRVAAAGWGGNGRRVTLILKRQASKAEGEAPPRPAPAPRARGAGNAAGAPRNARLRDGTILQGRYRIVTPLGAGGMSVVYKALDLHFTNVERVCAVKEMYDTAASERTRMLRLANFEREAGLLAVLSHPLIPKIYDFFSENGRIYLVQEFVPGRNLEVVVNDTINGFPEAEVIEWGVQVCDVLTYLHSQQPAPVIFRDLKPSNIMMRDDRSLMLIDFGIARTFQNAQRGTMIGTEGYAPPEQYRGIADARGDIYALGATLHHIATGNDPRFETPFTFDQRPPRSLNPALSEKFEAVILKAVSYAPADRFPAATEFKIALLDCRPTRVVVAAAGGLTRARPRPLPSRILPALETLDPPRPAPGGVAAPAGAAGAAEPAERLEPLPVEERLAWTVTTGDEVRGTGTIAGDAVLIGSYDGTLYAIDVAAGLVRWRHPTARGICGTPAVAGDLAIVGSEDGAVYGVTLDRGKLAWRFRTNMPVRSSPRVSGHAVYVGSDDCFVYKLDTASGDLLWRYRTYGPVRSSALLVDDLAIIGSDDGFIYALAQGTGRQVWRFATAKPVIASPVADHDVVVCGSLDGSVYGLGLKHGDQRWRCETGGPVMATAALRDGRAYLGSTDGRFHALDLRTGERAWDVAPGGRVTSSAAATAERLYVGGLDGAVYCLDRATGATSWSFTLGKPVPASPLLHDGLLVIGGTDGKVYALATGERAG
ncbi:MAG TPA: serine/threonine-protein kinase [Thermomicrobiales bacterium]|nr:serine/threonine-protein kinase [Thermomicrobiales bacterium]